MFRRELEDREAGTLEDVLPDALLEEFVASSEESQRVYLIERKLFDAYIAGVRAAMSVGWQEAQEVARLWELSRKRRALSYGRSL